jgi:glycosyltransferase involved in cell wall biosynthesis
LRAQLRVLLAAGIYPPDIGGPATWARQVAQGLAARGHAVRVLALADQAGPDRIARVRPRGLRVPATIAALARAAADHDVILATGLWPEAALAARLARCPLVARLPGDPAWERAVAAGLALSLEAFQSAALPWRWAGFRAVRAAAFRAADRVLVPSPFLAALAQGWGVAQARLRVVANAASTPTTGGEPDHDLVWAGRCVVQKRLDLLAHAAGLAGGSLLLLGDGPAPPPQAPHVTRLPPELPPPLWRGRVFVQASDYEGHPHALLEAMAAGLPVIATDVGGTAACFTHGVHGLLVPPGDAGALAAAITTLLHNPGVIKTMGDAARRHASACFGLETMLDATEALLHEVAAR